MLRSAIRIRALMSLAALTLAVSGCGGGSSPATAASTPTPPASSAPPASPTPPASPPSPAPPDAAAPDFVLADGTIPTYEAEFEDLFSLSKVSAITIAISVAEWNALLNDFDHNPRNEIFRKADFYYGDSAGNGEYVENVGFRLRGNVFSRARPEAGSGGHDPGNDLRRVHFRIKFNEQFQDRENVYGSREILTRAANKDREFRTVRSLNLKYNKNDPSYTREVFSYDLFRRFGVQTLRQAYTRLYIQIGDEPARYLGVYLMGEHLDKSWAQRRFGRNAYVFKSLYQGHGPADLSRTDLDHNIAQGRIGSELTDPGDAGIFFEAYRPAYDLKTRRTKFDKAEGKLNDLIMLLTGNPTQEMLAEAIDISQLLRAQAINVFLGNWDDYWRNGNNYYLVFDPERDKWVFVPYDYDIVLFDDLWVGGIAEASFMDWGADRLSGTPVLMQQVLSFADFREQYIGYIRDLLGDNSAFASRAAVLSRLGAQQDLVEPYLRDHDALDNTPYNPSLGVIDNYVTRRIATAQREVGL